MVGGIGVVVFGRLVMSWLMYMMRRFGTPGALVVLATLGVVFSFVVGWLIVMGLPG